ncbi:HAD family hydrolase [Acuticoccus sediminis]|uniref:hypothetical protein n=1 Tax=Acuticoccus sediminis TaxID=2184697 RepID=UPI001CFD3E0F|nr:hypothetical protein [Acuticoccus sediminis]
MLVEGRVRQDQAAERMGPLERAISDAPDMAFFVADPTSAGWLTDEIERRLGDGPSRILSIDVFDTLLMRDDSSELTRFREIGALMVGEVARAGGPAIPEIEGLVARHLGTRASYRAGTRIAQCREGALDEIHRTASRLLVGDERYAEAFVALELDYEVGRVAPNPLLAALAARHRARGGRVLLLSDMYLRAAHIERLLAASGIAADQYDALLSSADTKVSKASGGIFALAEEMMDATPGDFVHLGDSRRGDVYNPIERGWTALHLPIPNAQIERRRADHTATAVDLAERFGLQLEIAFTAETV